MLGSRNKRLVGDGLRELSRTLNFRCIEGLTERVIFRELYPRGLTAVDDLDEITFGARPTMSHVSAHLAMQNLMTPCYWATSEQMPKWPAASAARLKSTTASLQLTQPPAHFGGEALEEFGVIGLLRRLPDPFIEATGVVADQNAPALGLDAVENDLGGGGSRGRRLVAKVTGAFGCPA